MDLLSLKLRLADSHARVLHTAGPGERGADLEGPRFERVAAAAAPLIAEIERRVSGVRLARLRALSIDAVRRVVRASLAGGARGPGVRFEGAAWAELAPLVQPLARAALEEASPRRPQPECSPSEPGFWEDLYRTGGDRWELGRAAPPLVRYLRAVAPRGRCALVVGCGRGHEARLLSTLGADVVGIDFANDAIAAARALGTVTTDLAPDGIPPGALEFRTRDLFEMPRDPDRFDLIVEHTCFCAIDPARRADFARTVRELLVEGGELIGLFWAHGRAGGPPFGTTEGELRRLFEPHFRIEELSTPADSIAARAGEELLIRMRRS